MSRDYSLENLSSLVTADIGMRVKDNENYTPETPKVYSELATDVREMYGARMIKFIRAVGNVTDFKLSSPGFLETKLDTNNTGGDWTVGSSSFPCLHHLKFVQIKKATGSLNELKFLQVLLKKAIVLEKVTVFCYKRRSPDRAAQLKEFKEMLLAYPSASSGVSISIQ
ncbi:hypothetical protein C5167_030924 [Papaver somniferum]|nr:hypothetical protein C5167_030924 [Papaver somniferum]